MLHTNQYQALLGKLDSTCQNKETKLQLLLWKTFKLKIAVFRKFDELQENSRETTEKLAERLKLFLKIK